jgi:serine/threonine-protein kinase
MKTLRKAPISATDATVPNAVTGLPPELLERTIARVRVLCLVLFGTAALYAAIVFMLQRGWIGPWPRFQAAVVDAWARSFHVTAAAAMLLAGGVFAASFRLRLGPERVIRLGLVLQVLGALCITVAEHLAPSPPVVLGVSYVTIWILSFNLVPATPRLAALAAFSAATTGPIGLALNATWNHGVWPTPTVMVLHFLPNYVAASLSVLIAAMVHRLGTDVTRARRLGSYRLIEKLGQGGMGEVWRAEHRALIRPAAVKLLRRDLANGLTASETESMVRRFRREVQATSLLRSPHTVAVYDFGRSDEGTLYYVMELLSGIDLQQLVKRHGPQPPERVIHILRQVLHSLADAHRVGLVHRDIKPANLHLGVLGLELDFVKVLDFGLVKTRRARHDVGLTLEGAVQGTPAYLAPEAAVGGEVDARADLYSLGCVAYWLLTGTLVFGGENPMTMLAAHVRKAPEPPSRRSELPIPQPLEELVLELLAKDPRDRPQTSLEVIRRLERMVPPSPWTRERAERWWQGHLPQVLREHGALPDAMLLDAA